MFNRFILLIGFAGILRGAAIQQIHAISIDASIRLNGTVFDSSEQGKLIHLDEEAEKIIDPTKLCNKSDQKCNVIERGGDILTQESAGFIKEDGDATQIGQRNVLINNIIFGINIFFGLLAFISLFVLSYYGFVTATANGDDTKYQSGLKSIKYVTIAITGIFLSYLFIRFVVQILSVATG